ncbi:MAG TPA: DUF433 domain-containing protein [Desulfotomaculum sp.]|nr:DUF433 domain-containing protein [Desulfotomaculum sp.]
MNLPPKAFFPFECFGGNHLLLPGPVTPQYLELFLGSVTPQEILEDYPDLEPDDIKACLAFARALVANETIEPVNIEAAW